MNKKVELILPGGDFKRAKIALDYGANAVYVGLNKYSLRKGEVRFNISEIKKIIEYAHSINKKIYVTFNIFAHEEDLKSVELDIIKISKLKPDAFIIADLGVLSIAKKVAPDIPIHISTQANITNSEQIKFYKKIGVKRVVLARELTLYEIEKIHREIPEVELEVFAHGSMCISYSGRCLLSNYMTGRYANLGDCAQPCRWNYQLTQAPKNKHQNTNKLLTIDSKYKTQNSKYYLEEAQRKGEYFEIEETESGTNILSSKDLCTIEHIEEMIKSGITGFKVEGRNKTEYYLASVALAYRQAIDLSLKNIYSKNENKKLKKDLLKIAHRDYTTGFLFNEAKKGETYEGRSPIQGWEYIGLVTKNLELKAKNYHEVIVKNKIKKGQSVEVLTPKGIKKDKILEIIVDKNTVDEINPGKESQKALVSLKIIYPKDSLIRKRI